MQEKLRKSDLHLQRDEVLLRSVVQIAFEASPLHVLGADQALAGSAQVVKSLEQLGGEADILEDEPRLEGQVVEELLLDRRDRFAAALADRQCTEEIALVQYRCTGIGAGDRRQLPTVDRHGT